jgi:hypothetical protein
MFRAIATRGGHYAPSGHGPPRCARRPAGPGEQRQAPGMCGRLNPNGAPEGQKYGEGHTASAEAQAPGSTLCVVRPPRARRRRHSDLPGQGTGHLPYRVSRPVSRCHVAVGGAVSTAAATPPRDLVSVRCRQRILGRVEGGCTRVVQRSGHATVTACERRERGSQLIPQGTRGAQPRHHTDGLSLVADAIQR